MPKPPLVYVAGPYSHPDPVENTHLVVRIADALLDAGVVPLVPHLSLLWHLVSPKPHRRWLEYDRHLLRRCDALLRVPGDSVGATEETYLANRLRIPVLRPVSASPRDCVTAVGEWISRRNVSTCDDCDTEDRSCKDCRSASSAAVAEEANERPTSRRDDDGRAIRGGRGAAGDGRDSDRGSSRRIA